MPRKLNRREKMVRRIFSWEFIIFSHIVFVFFMTAALTGCSTFVTATVGDHTFESGVWLEKSVEENNEVQRDD